MTFNGTLPPGSMGTCPPGTGLQPAVQPFSPPLGQPFQPSPIIPGSAATPLTPFVPSIPGLQLPPIQEGPPPVMSSDYIPGFLTSIIGRNVRAEFVVGTNQYLDKTGRLVEVGVNFFVLQDLSSRNYIMCDLYSVKFVTILN